MGCAVGAKGKSNWLLELRLGVQFHGAGAFNADAVVWNVRKVLDKDAPHFDASQVGVTASRMPTRRTSGELDELSVELTTNEPDAFLPLNLTNLYGQPRVVAGEVPGHPCGHAGSRPCEVRPGRICRRRLGIWPNQDEALCATKRLEVVVNKNYLAPGARPRSIA